MATLQLHPLKIFQKSRGIFKLLKRLVPCLCNVGKLSSSFFFFKKSTNMLKLNDKLDSKKL